MVRWAYLVPRVIILALIALAVWVGSDPLIRRVVVNKLQNSTGGKVDIGNLRCTLSKQKIFIKDLALADPRLPMRNLMQAEMVYGELSPGSLLKRQVVLEHGQTSEVVFGAPRTDLGTIPGFPQPEPFEESEWKPKRPTSIEHIGLAWLDSLSIPGGQSHLTKNVELLQAAKGLEKFWQSELESQASKIEQLAIQKQQLKSTREALVLENPLRRQMINTEEQVQALASQTKTIEARLLELAREAAAQRASLESAHQHDLQKIRQSIQTISFDSDSVSRLLLTQFQEERVAEILEWFHWFRSTIPDPKTDFRAKLQRGENIVFPGVNPQPAFLIKSIEIEGAGRFANRHINFAGHANNLTTQPELHDQPATFELRAQGDQHIIVSCMLDRRSEDPIDTLKILCPDMEVLSRPLGEENSLLVTLGPQSRVQADIELRASGEQLTGELVFRHSNVSLHVDQLNDMLGGDTTALQINQGLSPVDRFESRVTISGSMNDYEFEFQSDLGSRFANAANRTMLEKNEQTLARRKQELDQFLQVQLAKLDREVIPTLKKLSHLLQEQAVEIANLQQTPPKDQSRLPKIR